MPISNEEKARIRGLVEVERLQSEGLSTLEQRKNANAIADQLLELSQQTSDAVVSEMAMLAHAGIASGQIAAAGAALASVNDQIASATNTFSLAARIAREGEANLTFPFIAGKAASLLDLLKTLETTVNDTIAQAVNIGGVDDLLDAFENAKTSVDTLREEAARLASKRGLREG